MTTEPNRQPEGIPTGGQFAKTTHSDRTVTLDDPRTARRAAFNRFATATDARILALKEDASRAQLRNMIDDLRQAHPEVQSFELYLDDDGDIAANFVRDADGNDIEEAEVDLTESLRAADPDEMQALACVPHDVDEMLAWEPEGGLAQDPADPFAHLTGMDKAKAQARFAQKASAEAAEAYVGHLASEILVAEPNAARLNVSRKVDVEYGHVFTLQNVINADGDVLDVDLTALQDEAFHDIHLDRHVDYDDSGDQSYIDLIPAK